MKSRTVAGVLLSLIPHSAVRVPHGKLALLLLFTLALPLHAQTAPKIDKVRLGLPTGLGDGGRTREGAWAPVYIHLKAGAGGNSQKQLKLVLEAQDAEENPYRYTVPVPALAAGVNEIVIGYLRSPGQEFTVSLQTVDGKSVQNFRCPLGLESTPLKPYYPLFVTLGGSNLPALKKVLLPVGPKDMPDFTIEGEDQGRDPRGYARLSQVADLPDRWFGYDAAEVVILTTDNDDFMTKLTASDAASRRKALAEWVRRGGKLVISVGRNHQLLNNLLSNMPMPESDKMPLLPFEITGSVQLKALPCVKDWAKYDKAFGGDAKNSIEVAKLVRSAERPEQSGLGDSTNVVLSESEKGEPLPIIVQSSCGLGRVWLIAFDVDGPPFNTWGGQAAFWTHVRDALSPLADPKKLSELDNNFQGRDRPELVEELQRYIDLFEEVPVISFAWVALFILLYIFVVGPLDYLVLKKVFKRLELTWVTFPTVIITISVSAYFIAYALKGDDLRVNKIDLVEIDLHTPQAYGTSWFSVFSPRIQNYTLSVEPVLNDGAPRGLTTPKASTTISLLESPAAATRGGSASLFRQAYEYTENAAGIERVPIPVWATRTFTASWRTPYPPDKPPIRAELVLNNGIVTGKIINELPVDLTDVCLFYCDRWYRLPNNRTLAAKGDLFDVTELAMGSDHRKGQTLDSWYTDPILTSSRNLPTATPRNQWRQSAIEQSYVRPALMKSLMFYREDKTNGGALNGGARNLSQHWRLVQMEGRPPFYRDEVILVARTPDAKGAAQKINQESLVRLWNDELPGTAEQAAPLSGFLDQETYVRVYIPVKQP